MSRTWRSLSGHLGSYSFWRLYSTVARSMQACSSMTFPAGCSPTVASATISVTVSRPAITMRFLNCVPIELVPVAVLVSSMYSAGCRAAHRFTAFSFFECTCALALRGLAIEARGSLWILDRACVCGWRGRRIHVSRASFIHCSSARRTR